MFYLLHTCIQAQTLQSNKRCRINMQFQNHWKQHMTYNQYENRQSLGSKGLTSNKQCQKDMTISVRPLQFHYFQLS